jgi:hypothetical protein
LDVERGKESIQGLDKVVGSGTSGFIDCFFKGADSFANSDVVKMERDELPSLRIALSFRCTPSAFGGFGVCMGMEFLDIFCGRNICLSSAIFEILDCPGFEDVDDCLSFLTGRILTLVQTK